MIVSSDPFAGEGRDRSTNCTKQSDTFLHVDIVDIKTICLKRPEYVWKVDQGNQTITHDGEGPSQVHIICIDDYVIMKPLMRVATTKVLKDQMHTQWP